MRRTLRFVANPTAPDTSTMEPREIGRCAALIVV